MYKNLMCNFILVFYFLKNFKIIIYIIKMENQLEKLLDKLRELMEIIFKILIENNENVDDENRNKLKYIFRKYEEIFYLIMNDDVENGYNLLFELKQWRTENINNYLFSCDEGKKLIQEIMEFNISFMTFQFEIMRNQKIF